MIRSGPRWIALNDAVGEAIRVWESSASSGPTTTSSSPWASPSPTRSAGSLADVAGEALEALQRASDALRYRPDDLPPIPTIADLDSANLSMDQVAWLSEIDLRRAELLKAEEVAAEMDHFVEWLKRQPDPRVRGGANLRDAMCQTVLALRDHLSSGNYLTSEDLFAWGTLLAGFGIRRLGPEEYRPNRGRFGPGTQGTVDINHIADYPRGKFWKTVVVFDEHIIDFLFSEAARTADA